MEQPTTRKAENNSNERTAHRANNQKNSRENITSGSIGGADKSALKKRKPRRKNRNLSAKHNLDVEHANEKTTVRTTKKQSSNKNNQHAIDKIQANNELRLQRKQQVDQMLHALGPQVVLLRKGQYVTTYSLGVPSSFSSDQFKLIFNVPLDYPKSSIKLTRAKDSSSGSQPSIRVMNNFNYKAKLLLRSKQPILAQLNYLVTNLKSLESSNYIDTDKIASEFMSSKCSV